MEKEFVMLPISKLVPHPDNPRKELGDLTELADSIRAKGVFQNLTVVPHGEDYRIIIGHRRRAASELAGLTQLPCAVVEMTEREQLETMLLENMQREDLTPYEQAQGFQLMIDMGESVEEVARKTGFSQSTVRRRLKMAELDQTVLKEVSGRQISMEDFDTLAKLDDIKVRNECLKTIGTANFSLEVTRKIKKQNIEKNRPWVEQLIRSHKAKKITNQQTWYGDHTQIGETYQLDKLKGNDIQIPDTGGKKLFYCLEEDGRLRFFLEREKAKPVKRPQEEIDREKAQAEANEKCKELDEMFCQLRENFVAGLTLHTKNRDTMLEGAIKAIIRMGFQFGSVGSDKLCRIVGEERKWGADEDQRITGLLLEKPEKTYPGIIYTAFCDSKDEGYHSTYKQKFPRHQNNKRLNALYEWLCSLGYVMSDEEKAMQDGSHPLLQIEKKEDK